MKRKTNAEAEDNSKRFCTHKIFIEDTKEKIEWEDNQEETLTSGRQNSVKANVEPHIPERFSEITSPDGRKMEFFDESASKKLKEMEQQRLADIDNKEKLKQLYMQAKSPRPSRRVIESTTNEKELEAKTFEVHLKDSKDDYKRLWR